MSEINDNKNHVVELNHPITRGEQTLEKISVREPLAGELRGLKLFDVVSMDVAAYIELLPRITQPALTKAEVGQLHLADLTPFMTVVAGFFEGKPSQSA